MRRKTGWMLTASYLGFMGALGATAVWAEQMVTAVLPPIQTVTLGSAADRAPEFALQDLDGNSVTLASLRGEREDHVVVLEWFDPDCDRVEEVHSSTAIQGLYEEFQPAGVRWAAVYSSAPPEGQDAAEINRKAAHDWELQYPVLLDPGAATARLYHVTQAPSLVVISATGDILYSGAVENPASNDDATLQQVLRAAIKGEKPKKSPPSCQGCNLDGMGAGGQH
ncbi:MAG: redoxin domain-containing protein [Phycisphaerales bacterium]|nr:redoxin domain-containing protein [Phycisphaerales bacterium]